MSWYLFNNSPQREYRGKKVDGYQNLPRNKVILDWGLGQLSPKKQNNTITRQQQPQYNYIQKPQRNSKSLHHQKYQPKQKTKLIQQAIKVLTESSDQQNKEQLLKVVNNYGKNKDKLQNQYMKQSDPYPGGPFYNNQKANKSLNVLNPIEFDADKFNRSKSKQPVDNQAAKRMRFLENSLLPGNRKDNMTAVLDYDLNQKVTKSSLGDSRLSGYSKFGNKKNESDVRLGDGFNVFVPMKQKVKDMNQKLKQMYDYDEWCKRRQTSQIRLG